jgi:hypothetical protein
MVQEGEGLQLDPALEDLSPIWHLLERERSKLWIQGEDERALCLVFLEATLFTWFFFPYDAQPVC